MGDTFKLNIRKKLLITKESVIILVSKVYICVS
jgi:hypothetical protein